MSPLTHPRSFAGSSATLRRSRSGSDPTRDLAQAPGEWTRPTSVSGGKWKYLFRAVDKHGRLIAFMLSDRRNTNAAYRFLRKALKTMSDYPPSSITTDKLASYPKAILRLQNEGLLSKDVKHRTSKYLNNILEADHGALKRVIRPNARLPDDENLSLIHI